MILKQILFLLLSQKRQLVFLMLISFTVIQSYNRCLLFSLFCLEMIYIVVSLLVIGVAVFFVLGMVYWKITNPSLPFPPSIVCVYKLLFYLMI